MKAILYKTYGPPEVLQPAEIDPPVLKDHDLLVQVRATSVNYGDLIARRFGQVSPREFNMPAALWFLARLSFGWSRPRQPVLGSQFAGEVAAVGPSVTRYKVGDAVYGYTGAAMRAYAEYLAVSETSEIARKPANLSFEEAAIVPYGAITAYNLLKNADLQPGRKILIVGASGSIGSAAVQLAKMHGLEVTGVCSTPRRAYVQSLGADHVIDYTREEVRQSGQTYDIVLDVLGRLPLADYEELLNPNGVFLAASFKLPHLLKAFTSRSAKQGHALKIVMAPEKTNDLDAIRALVEAGQFKSVLDKTFPLAEAAAAHRYAESDARAGGIALTV